MTKRIHEEYIAGKGGIQRHHQKCKAKVGDIRGSCTAVQKSVLEETKHAFGKPLYRLPDFDGQAADAISACTQVKMEDAPTLLKSKIRMSRCVDTSSKT